MRKVYPLIILVTLACCLFACKKQNDAPPQPSITGKWNLQKFDMAQYFNGQLAPPATLLPVASSIVFNNNGTFIDAYSSPSIGVIDTTKGNYNLSGSTLSFSNSQSKGNGPAGTILPSPLPLFFSISFNPATSTTNIQVKQITASILTINTEIISTSGSDTAKEVLNEYYAR
jgi:hypothetical protein